MKRYQTYRPIGVCMIPVANSCSLVQSIAQSAVLYFRPLFPRAAFTALKYSFLILGRLSY